MSQVCSSTTSSILIDKFGVSDAGSAALLFIFLAANAVGAFFGGPLGDRFGRKYVSGFQSSARCRSRGAAYAGPVPSAVLTVFIGLILSSATSSIIVFAQELMPHRFGMISGVSSASPSGSASRRRRARASCRPHQHRLVYHLCAFLPAIGLLAIFLPKCRSMCSK